MLICSTNRSTFSFWEDSNRDLKTLEPDILIDKFNNLVSSSLMYVFNHVYNNYSRYFEWDTSSLFATLVLIFSKEFSMIFFVKIENLSLFSKRNLSANLSKSPNNNLFNIWVLFTAFQQNLYQPVKYLSIYAFGIYLFHLNNHKQGICFLFLFSFFSLKIFVSP
ncbi:MAG: hypothetical protein XD37_0030 [Thermoanaerobacter thermocopriae]|nr:MAG: hypothetical protein XD37_0030 [Thermoanaerobacter thermocopriae]